MTVLEPLGDIDQDRSRPLRIESALDLENGIEGPTLHQLYGEIELPVFELAEIENPDYIAMLETGRRPRFLLEAQDQLRSRVRMEQFDGHIAVENLIPGLIDRSHTAGSEPANDFIAISDYFVSLHIAPRTVWRPYTIMRYD